MEIIPKIHTHRSQLLSIDAERGPRQQANLFERAVMFVVIKKVRPGIISYIQVRPAIIIVVSPDGSQAVAMPGIIHASLLRDLLERAIPPVVVQEIALAFHAPRPALHKNSFIPAKLLVAPKLRKPVDIQMDVPRDKQLDL